jgi:S1-C subfamily serine protease
MNKLISITLLTALSVPAFATDKSIRPSRMLINLFKLNSTKRLTDKGVKVSGVKLNKLDDSYLQYGNSFYIPEKTFDRANKLGKSVFRATPGDDSSAHGTAFAVGGNLILTNQHVLSKGRMNTTKCRSFRIRLNSNQKNKTLSCKEVHYCSKNLDFCLIEMKNHKKGYSLSKETPLKLASIVPYGDQTEAMIIGNPIGFGLHASKGIGVVEVNSLFKFFAPVWGGNSGGPVFNKFDEVIGVIRAQSKKLMSEDSYNVAVGIDTVIAVLKANLKDKPEVLNQLNL